MDFSDRNYWFDIDGKQVPNEEAMLSRLLDENILFCNSRKFQEPDSNEIREETIVLFINCNDIFAPAADAECLTLSELPDLFRRYQKVEDWAVCQFVGLKRKMQPRRRIRDRMIEEGAWLEEFDAFPLGCY